MDFNRTELRAMLLATGLLLLGAAARLGLTPGPAEVTWIEAEMGRGSGTGLSDTRRLVAAGVLEEERASRPIQPGERLDPNTAPEVELRRLPGIGPARAAAIISERTAGGPFRDLQDLTRVPGIGMATLSDLVPRITLSKGLSGSGLRRSEDASGARPTRVDVNRAQIKELEQITGIGPVLAARIVETRLRLGRFRVPEDLLAVPGIGPGILHRIRGELRF